MENFLRDNVDLTMISQTAMSTVGDAHFFEDSTPPIKIRQYLDSNQVSLLRVIYVLHRKISYLMSSYYLHVTSIYA